MAYKKSKKAGIHHICLRVPDLKRTVEFYMKGLGAAFVVEWGKEGTADHAVLLDLGEEDILEIFEAQDDLRMGKWQHVAVLTDDIEASIKKAVAAGARVDDEPCDSHIPTWSGEVVDMRFCFLVAPGGEILEFIQNI